MAKIISETLYGGREPQWLVERPKEQQSHFDQRGCVRQIKSTSHAITTTRHTGNDLPISRSSAGFFTEQPSDRRAYVYSAAPATHRPAVNSSFNAPIVEFMVPLCCGKCLEKVKDELENDEGVYGVVCDLHNQRVTVSSDLDPHWLLKRIKRIKKNSHFWRGSTHLKDAHYITTRFPGEKSFHHGQVPPQHVEIPAYRDSAHHRPSPRSRNQRYVAPGLPLYDDVAQTEYLESHGDREYYYAGAEYRYKPPFDVHVYDNAPVNNSLRHGHPPSPYGLPYETEEYGYY